MVAGAWAAGGGGLCTAGGGGVRCSTTGGRGGALPMVAGGGAAPCPGLAAPVHARRAAAAPGPRSQAARRASAALGTTYATGTSCHLGLGRPITAASATAGCSCSAAPGAQRPVGSRSQEFRKKAPQRITRLASCSPAPDDDASLIEAVAIAGESVQQMHTESVSAGRGHPNRRRIGWSRCSAVLRARPLTTIAKGRPTGKTMLMEL